MSILPNKRPTIKASSFRKICVYFLGDDWQTEYPIVEVAIRHPKLNFYDDELAVWTNRLSKIKTFNWNADPAAYIMKGQPKAILKKGVHFYKLSYHHINEPAKRYVALRPATPGEQLLVWRSDGKGGFYSSVGTAIDQHYGGNTWTFSEGCQTTHISQYPEFIQTIGEALGVKVPLGNIRKADPALMKGIGRWPYILIDQADFDYIVGLPESEFDSADDLKYQTAHFVGVPKIARVTPIETVAPNAAAVTGAIEQESITAETAESFPSEPELDPEPVKDSAPQPSEPLDAESESRPPTGFSPVLGTALRRGMDAYQEVIKVTSGKTRNFVIQVFGLIFSAVVGVIGFARENWKLIAVGVVGFIVLCIVIAVVFTALNMLKMKYAADPDKHNVE
ncbi:MAG: hypothetical protein JSS81_05915 [Acidobacteria bacterium]|nr:hypothetical protein [Acidobacteriota bacterium]